MGKVFEHCGQGCGDGYSYTDDTSGECFECLYRDPGNNHLNFYSMLVTCMVSQCSTARHQCLNYQSAVFNCTLDRNEYCVIST